MNTELFKKKLEAELVVVEKELRSVAVQNPHNPKDWEATERQMDTMPPMADQNEAADKMEEYTENRAITDELEVRYNAVKNALKKIEEQKQI